MLRHQSLLPDVKPYTFPRLHRFPPLHELVARQTALYLKAYYLPTMVSLESTVQSVLRFLLMQFSSLRLVSIP